MPVALSPSLPAPRAITLKCRISETCPSSPLCRSLCIVCFCFVFPRSRRFEKPASSPQRLGSTSRRTRNNGGEEAYSSVGTRGDQSKPRQNACLPFFRKCGCGRWTAVHSSCNHVGSKKASASTTATQSSPPCSLTLPCFLRTAYFIFVFCVSRPVSAAALALLLRRGEVDGMTMAWTTGMGDWKPLGEV